ncbi:MAG: hypothetical protein WKF82_00925 [Nocardioidaceae bacterium]
MHQILRHTPSDQPQRSSGNSTLGERSPAERADPDDSTAVSEPQEPFVRGY